MPSTGIRVLWRSITDALEEYQCVSEYEPGAVAVCVCALVRSQCVRIAVALVCVCVTRWCVRESEAGSGRAERSEVRGQWVRCGGGAARVGGVGGVVVRVGGC